MILFKTQRKQQQNIRWRGLRSTTEWFGKPLMNQWRPKNILKSRWCDIKRFIIAAYHAVKLCMPLFLDSYRSCVIYVRAIIYFNWTVKNNFSIDWVQKAQYSCLYSYGDLITHRGQSEHQYRRIRCLWYELHLCDALRTCQKKLLRS